MNHFHIIDELLPGIYVLGCPQYFDERGLFTKFYHSVDLTDQKIIFTPAESFLTKSSLGVLRGMHFQTGKAAHDKMVFCATGHVLDVIVDIRPKSPNFNKPVSIELKASVPVVLLISKNYAHGFLSLEDESIMLYSTTTVHQPDFDCGVLWSSIDFNWPIQNPILSKRDREHPSINHLL